AVLDTETPLLIGISRMGSFVDERFHRRFSQVSPRSCPGSPSSPRVLAGDRHRAGRRAGRRSSYRRRSLASIEVLVVVLADRLAGGPALPHADEFSRRLPPRGIVVVLRGRHLLGPGLDG